jgi:L-asparaginase
VYESGRVDASDLVSEIEGLERLADVHSETMFATGSENLGPHQWRLLARRIEELTADSDVDGVVVTHGTDTIEEAAFFLELVCKSGKPVVLTAAMRPSTALSADGPANLFQAVLAATSPQLQSHGLLVVMNGLVIPGWQIIKTDSVALDSFHAYPGGPIGKIVGESLLVFGSPNLSPLEGRFQDHLRNDDELPFVDIVLLHAGRGDQPLADFEVNSCKGLVVAGFGGGTMPDNLNGLVAETANSGCTVVVSSRVSRVTVLAETMTSVKSKNVFPSGLLNPQKSALLLSLALDANLDARKLAELFNVFVIQ